KGASENGAAVLGNVLDNDDLGADHGTVGTDGRVDGVVAGAGGGATTGGTNLGGIAGTYGQLALNADGTYSYTPTAGLSVPSGSTDVFTYTVIDADGDTATAELTITFSGDNFHATAGNTTALVDEDDLATGNNDAAAGDDVPSAQPGVLPHDYGPDGAGSIKLVSGSETVNGVSYTYTVNADGTVLTANDGTQDVFRVTLTDAEAGTYTVELLARVEHDNANGSPGFEDNLDFTLGYEVYDADDVTGTPGTLTLTIDDDVPVISTDDLAVYRVPGITTGTYSFDVGADIATFDASFQEGALIWTNQPADYSFGLKAGTTQTYEATYEDGGSTKTYFEITINDDGTYDFNLVTPAPVITTGSGPLLAGISGSSGLSSYTIPASSFGGAFELVITGYTNGVPDTISISSTELGVGDGVLHNSNTKDEVIRLDVVQQPGYENTTLDTLTLGLASTGSLATGDEFLLTVTYTNGTTEDIQMSYDGSGTATFDIDQTKTVDYVEFDILSKNVNAKITGVTLEYTTTVDPADSLLNFELTGADSDGDEATDPFTVNVMAGTSNDDTITTGSDNDQISGGAGDDIINGGGGADLLIGGEGDDLLIGGEGQNTYDLTDTDGAIDTVVLDPSALTGMNPDEIIGFSSEDVVDLTELVSLSTTSGENVGDFVRLNPGDGKELQVDADGTAGGDDWVTVATFDVPQTPASIKILYDDDGSDTSGTV
ncbi:VCBS domain-containing protein, partial [Nitratireductor aquibiodomus]|uniref:Ig-like domain-containing protein n=1 Tax=Nitratireductor aquibiodomus TaxID=204799 RepID=UPI0019D411D0